MGRITGGHGVGLQIGGSGTMMPSARAIAGINNVEISITDKQIVNRTALGFIISSWTIKLRSFLLAFGCGLDGRKSLKVPVV
jgi:hypothetical protein